jgi:6-phosphogluconolactonase
MKYIFKILMILLPFSLFAQDHHYLLTGSYTSGKSKGIYVYDFNSRDGSAKLVDSIATVNPSYLAIAPGQKFVYAVSETGNGAINAFGFDQKTGHLSSLNSQSSMGDNPCYVAVDKTGKWVAVGNYSSGTLAIFPVGGDGSLGAPVTSIKHSGHGANPSRQEGPHVHATVFSPDNKFLFVPDLGIDKLMIYSFNEKTGALTQARDSVVELKGGSGPRHFDFHPNKKWAYLIQELAGTVTAYSYSNGHLKTIQTISTLPKGFTKRFSSADIHVSHDGKFLYASNRDSSNTIAIYRIDQKTGRLSLTGHQSTLGKTPRNFNFDPTGNYLLVANQNSDDIIVFKINRQTGLLKDTGRRIDTGSPVCVKWAKKE